MIIAVAALLLVATITAAARLFNFNWTHKALTVLVASALIIILGILIWHLVREYPALLITPLPLALAFCALTFGFGPLVHFFGPEAVQESLLARWRLDHNAIFRVQILNIVGVTTTLWGVVTVAYVASSIEKGRLYGMHREQIYGSAVRTDALVVQVPVSGRTLVYGWLVCFSLAAVLRGAEWVFNIDILGVLPGALSVLGKIGWVAVLLAAVVVGRRGGLNWLILLPTVLLEVIAGGLALSRTDVLMPLVITIIGLFVVRRRASLLLIGFLVIAGSYVGTRHLVDVARSKVWTGESYTAAQFYAETARGDIEFGLQKGIQSAGWWKRFNYTPVQHALMDRYDHNHPGETYNELPWMFAPRVMFPEKPILDHGREVSEMLFGFDTSSTGVTPYGEAYWNGGWPYVVLSGWVMGGLLAIVTIACIWLFLQRSILGWTVGLYGIAMGRLVRNFFISGVVGSFVVFLFLLMVYWAWRQQESTIRRVVRKV